MYSPSSVLIGKTLPINAHSLTLHPTFSLLIHKCTTPTSPLLFSKHCNQCLYHPPTLPTLTLPQSLWENTSYPPIPLTLRFKSPQETPSNNPTLPLLTLHRLPRRCRGCSWPRGWVSSESCPAPSPTASSWPG